MRLLVYLLLVGFAVAQLRDLPSCAIMCFVSSIPYCSSTDIHCMCTTPPDEFLHKVVKCAEAQCDDLKKVIRALRTICEYQGVDLPDNYFEKFEAPPPPPTSMCMCPCACPTKPARRNFRNSGLK
ncbi:hypothetical protein TWF225_002723 [Orbilia oligospora]|nr:hypothetical protein TWF225_002723 [Orbilia oligospora]KAF3241394.1 hypothetical protein TWF217_012056 [Orbilia oligospora]KAF3253701.1 hypothetical protein TWF128_006328 [Orbilia oligospora]KAF3297835.1 hypothetical protein TWF132_003988 [Orbilia oligospora]